MTSRLAVTAASVLVAQLHSQVVSADPVQAASAPPRVLLEADAEAATLVFREGGQWTGNAGWRPLCVAPCGAPLFPGYEFRVTAPGKTPSAPFVLPYAATTAVSANMGSKAPWVIGIVLTSLGGAAAGLGLTVAALTQSCGGELGCDTETSAAAIGVMALGLTAMATGIYLFTSNRTSVSIAPSIPLGRGVSLGPHALEF